MGVDQFLDMGRSATNAVGNSIAAAVIAKWENGIDPNANVANIENAKSGKKVA